METGENVAVFIDAQQAFLLERGFESFFCSCRWADFIIGSAVCVNVVCGSLHGQQLMLGHSMA